MRSIELFTIGHSNHSLELFLDLLQQHAIEVLADIRRFPASRSFPHFNRETLSAAVEARGMDYTWLEALGGRRPKAKEFESPNLGLRNSSFRNCLVQQIIKSMKCRNTASRKWIYPMG